MRRSKGDGEEGEAIKRDGEEEQGEEVRVGNFGGYGGYGGRGAKGAARKFMVVLKKFLTVMSREHLRVGPIKK